MRFRTERRGALRETVSPGTLIGLTALVVAMTGSAVALPGTNSVNSGDIKNGQVKTRDLAANSVTGAKVKESTLGKVPNADSVDGIGMRSFLVEVETNQPSEFVDVGGIELDMNCADVDPQVSSRNSSGQAASLVVTGIYNDGNVVPFAERDTDFASDDFQLLTTLDSNDATGQSTTQVTFADGTVTTVELSWSNELRSGESGCSYWGQITSG